MAKTHFDWLEVSNNSANPTDTDTTRRGFAIVGKDPKYYNGTTWVTLEHSGISETFVGLTDTPSAFTDAGNKILKVNTGADALEFVTASGDVTMSATGVFTIAAKAVDAAMTSIADGKIFIGGSGGAGAEQTLTGDVTVSNSGVTTIGAAKVHASMLGLLDDTEVIIGTTTATAATKISLEFDETTTGIGLMTIGSVSVPMVLNTNPGSTVIADTLNILHSAGAGDCDDLMGSYTKVAVSGDGDSGLTVVGTAQRLYVGTSEDNSAVQEAYAIQPWAKHTGTGTLLAMSGVSAALILGDGDAFTSTNSINAGHFHIKTYEGAANGTVTSSNFDGVMIEAWANVTGLDSMLNLSNGGTSTTSMVRMDLGTATNVFEMNDAEGIASVTNGSVLNDISSTANAGYIKVKIGDTTRYIAIYEAKS